MPLIPDTIDQPFSPLLAPVVPPPVIPDPSVQESFSSSFQNQNDVTSVYNYLQRKEIAPDPEYTPFKLSESLKARGLWDERDAFIHAQSDMELDAIQARRMEERRNQGIRARSGWTGFLADVAAGVLSPTILMPIAKGASLTATAGKVALSVGASTAMQEAALYATQETRTPEESAVGIGASILGGGLLGGLAHYLSKEAVAKIGEDMVSAPGAGTIPEPRPIGIEDFKSVGASVVDKPESAGGLKTNAINKPILDKMSYTNPVDMNIQQPHRPSFMEKPSPVMQDATTKFSQTLKLEGNSKFIAASPGGNVEDLTLTYGGDLRVTLDKLADQYVDYVFNGAPPKLATLEVAQGKAMLNKGLLRYDQFQEEVSLTRASGAEHEIPQVIKASKEAGILIDNLYKDGIREGIFTGEERILGGDANYLMHAWNADKLNADPIGAVDMFARNFEKVITADFEKKLSKLREKQSRAQTFLDDANRSDEEVATLKEQFQQELDNLTADASPEVLKAHMDITEAGSKLRIEPKKKAIDPKTGVVIDNKPALRQTIADAKTAGGEAYTLFKTARSEINRRLDNLSKSKVVMEAKFAKRLASIERNETLQAGTLLRGAKKIQSLLNFKGTKTQLKKALTEVKNDFEKTGALYDRAEAKLNKLSKTQGEVPFKLMDGMEKRANKMTELADRIKRIENFAKEAFDKEIDNLAKDALAAHAEIVSKRAVRNERLKTGLKKFSPEESAARVAAKQIELNQLGPKFEQSFGKKYKALENVDSIAGTADFATHAKDAAKRTVEKLLNMNDRRLSYSDLIAAERGPELLRVLAVSMAEAQPWLHTNIEHILKLYSRTIGADISVKKVFGTTDISNVILDLTNERMAALEHIQTLTDKKTGALLSDSAKIALNKETNNFYNRGKDDLLMFLNRIRGTHGLPDNPDGWAYRMGTMALEVNKVTLLNGALIASIADAGRPIQKFGLLRTFGDSIIPYIKDFKNYTHDATLARWSGATVDTYNHTRINGFADVYDEIASHTVLERGIKFLSSKVGSISLLNQWTRVMKTITAGVANAKLMSSLAMVMGEVANPKELARATEYLASLNIDEDIARIMWGEVERNGGGVNVGGTWMPVLEKWDTTIPQVKDAQRTYLAAVNRSVNNTILTPGLALPRFMDANLPGRMVGQFKAFPFAATQKIVMAGLQEPDMAFVNGALISLALGSLSYYLYATAVGGSTQQKMLNAIDEGNWELWMDEAISRSGQTGAFDILQRISSRVPGLNQYTSFNGGPITKQTGGGLMAELGGPSFGLAKKVTDIVSSASDPDRRTEHLIRQLLPYQNHFAFRRILDHIENSVGDVFELQGKRQ